MEGIEADRLPAADAHTVSDTCVHPDSKTILTRFGQSSTDDGEIVSSDGGTPIEESDDQFSKC
jgi:hypothetical protein